jgi:hypothetical protein
MRCTYKDVPKRGSGIKGYVLTVTKDEHSHPLADDPLVYPTHRHSTSEYQEQIVQARTHREKVLPFSTSRRVLEDPEYGLMISSREYYNQVRKLCPDKTKL